METLKFNTKDYEGPEVRAVEEEHSAPVIRCKVFIW